VKRIIWIGNFLFLIVLSNFALAKDCQLGERYYQRAKSATQPSQCIKWLHMSAEACPNFNAWYMLGLLYRSQGQRELAIDAFTKARSEAASPSAEALALGRKGELLVNSGQLPQAIRNLELAKRFHPAPTPDWIERSLKNTRIRYYRHVLPAKEISSFLNAGLQADKSGRFVVRPAVNLPVQFGFDRADLNPAGYQQVIELGRALANTKMNQWSFLLAGHTDKRGTVIYNQVLSEKRAATVRIELEKQFPSLVGRLQTEGRGETELLYDGNSEVDHMLNRRVKVILIQ
jgi:outer membrane protein OmpA-like peptidoglycan-associated protein